LGGAQDRAPDQANLKLKRADYAKLTSQIELASRNLALAQSPETFAVVERAVAELIAHRTQVEREIQQIESRATSVVPDDLVKRALDCPASAGTGICRRLG
jgi:hypothetical protein